MKIAGVIAEYNPFHNGHAYHLRQTREITGCDYIVVCMDGHFTQRGEAARWSKWTRARMALENGADAVIELPTLHALRTADAFAGGGVAILGGVGVDLLSFGSEQTDLSLLRNMAEIRANEPESVSERIRCLLDEGMSHAKARGIAAAEYLGIDPEILNQPNLILGAEYIRAINASCPEVEPVPVRRIGGYHDAAMGEVASASAIRAAFDRGEDETAYNAMPDAVSPEKIHAMDDLLLYRLRDMTMEELSSLPDAGEGLDSRLYRLCREVGSHRELLEKLKCRRYTHARLSRLLMHAMLGIANDIIKKHPMPTYARLLGMRADAAPLMKVLSDRSRLPIVSSATALRDDPCFAIEERAADLWALLHDDSELRRPGREFTEKFVRV